jgi:hypothetical protein
LRIGGGSCEGKHFAFTIDAARKWGMALYENARFAVIRVTALEQTLTKLMVWERLDGIGPACFAGMDELDGLEIVEVIDEP